MSTWQDNARRIMAAKSIKQREIVDRLQLSPGTVSHWMHGRHRPSLKQLKEISVVLGVSLPELLEGDESFVRDGVELELVRAMREIDPSQREQAVALVLAVLSTLPRKPPE